MSEKLLWCLLVELSGNMPFVTCWKPWRVPRKTIHREVSHEEHTTLKLLDRKEVLGEAGGSHVLSKPVAGEVVCPVEAEQWGSPRGCRSWVLEKPGMLEKLHALQRWVLGMSQVPQEPDMGEASRRLPQKHPGSTLQHLSLCSVSPLLSVRKAWNHASWQRKNYLKDPYLFS